MTSTMVHNKKADSTIATKGARRKMALAIGFWLIVWQSAAFLLGQELLLVSPLAVLHSLGTLVVTSAFWQSVGQSFVRIGGGFLLGAAAGCACAALGARFATVRTLFAPLFGMVRAIPVASFVILALLWAGSNNLSVVISFLMVAPVLYISLLAGLDARDPGLAEMAEVFRIAPAKRLRYLTLPAVLPWIASGCRTAIGLAWKSGVAAEVIGLPRQTIGERLYQTKLYLETGELFAWTLVIILLSAACEKLVTTALNAAERRLCR